MYSCLKAGEYLEAMNVAKKYTKTVEKCSYYVPEIKKRKTREGEAIVEMIEGGQVQRIDTVLTQNLYDNLKMLNLSTTIEDNHDQNSSKATGRHWKYFE